MGGQNGVCPVVGPGGELWRGALAGGPSCSLTSLRLLGPVVCGVFGYFDRWKKFFLSRWTIFVRVKGWDGGGSLSGWIGKSSGRAEERSVRPTCPVSAAVRVRQGASRDE